MIELLNERYYYDGRNLRVKVKFHGRVKVGELAGTESVEGYRVIGINRRDYKEHRLIWLLHYGEIPKGMQIDHINGVRDDNRLDNLRLVSNQDNQKNAARSRNNTSGVVGVSWHKPSNKWQAGIRINGKRIYLGSFNNFDDAVQARKEAEIKYNFHKNHGRNKHD